MRRSSREDSRPGRCRHGIRRSAGRCRGPVRNAGRLSLSMRDCHRDSNSRVAASGGRGGPGLATDTSAQAASARRLTVIVAPSALKSTALSMSLSSICTIRSGAPVISMASSVTSQSKAPLGEGAAIGTHRRADQCGEVEALPFAMSDGLLDPGGGAHRRQDRAQALAALPRARDVDRASPSSRMRLGLEVLEGRPDYRQRCTDLVRQLAGESSQITRVLVEPPEQGGEAARQVAELVAGIGFGQYARDVAFAPERGFARGPEPRDTQGHAAGEPECGARPRTA